MQSAAVWTPVFLIKKPVLASSGMAGDAYAASHPKFTSSGGQNKLGEHNRKERGLRTSSRSTRTCVYVHGIVQGRGLWALTLFCCTRSETQRVQSWALVYNRNDDTTVQILSRTSLSRHRGTLLSVFFVDVLSISSGESPRVFS